MPIRSILILIKNENRNDLVDAVYKRYMADLLLVVAMNKKIDGKGLSWIETYETIIGVNRVEQTPATDIITSTMTKWNIKFADETEARRILGDKADEFIQFNSKNNP